MTIAYFCIMVAMLIPVLCAGYAKISSKNYDNRAPRDFAANLQGKAKRANNAQSNAYEAFPPFAAGIIVAHLMHAPQQAIDLLAISFIAARMAYTLFYIYDLHTWRSLAWFAGFGITISLFFIGI